MVDRFLLEVVIEISLASSSFFSQDNMIKQRQAVNNNFDTNNFIQIDMEIGAYSFTKYKAKK